MVVDITIGLDSRDREQANCGTMNVEDKEHVMAVAQA